MSAINPLVPKLSQQGTEGTAKTADWKKDFSGWLKENMGIGNPMAELIVRHVEHYYNPLASQSPAAGVWGTDGSKPILQALAVDAKKLFYEKTELHSSKRLDIVIDYLIEKASEHLSESGQEQGQAAEVERLKAQAERDKEWNRKMQEDFNAMYEYALKKCTKEELLSVTKHLKEILG